MMWRRIIIVLLWMLIPCGAFAENALQNHLDRGWLNGNTWSGPEVEVSSYDGRDIIDRRARPAEVHFLVGRNEFEKPEHGKNDKALPVLDVQVLQTATVGLWDRNVQTSILLSYPNLQSLALVTTEQEWGLAAVRTLDFADVLGSGLGSQAYALNMHQAVNSNRYQHDKINMKSFRDAIAYESLPILLRAINPAKGGFNLRMIEPSSKHKSGVPRVGELNIVVQPAETYNLRGEQIEVRPLTVSHYLGEDRFWIELANDRRLVKWLRYNGGELLLRRSKKMKYWQKNQPQDSGKLDN